MSGTGMTTHGHVVHGVAIMRSDRSFCGIPRARLTTFWPGAEFPSGTPSVASARDCKRCLRSLSA